MNLAQCKSPVMIVNPYSKEKQSVPCGRCEVCRNSKSSIWVQRLQQEIACWPYTAFVTLTYDDDHLPTLTRHGDTLVNIDTGFMIDMPMDAQSRKYINKRRCLPVLDYRDVQLFLKRLRALNNDFLKFTHENKTIRFFVCGEYGPTTFRPHYHMLLFISSKKTASNLDTLLHKAWKLGNYDFSFASVNAAQYVAQYVNCTYNLPQVLAHSLFRPFCHSSKCPPVGSLSVPTKEIQEIFHHGISRRALFDRSTSQFTVVPVWRFIQDKLFPRISGFDYLLHSTRTLLYGLSKVSGCETESEFEEWLKFQNRSCWKSEFFVYISELLARDFNSKSHSSVRNLWYISRRVLRQCEVFNCDLDYYVSRIELYYSNKAYCRLTEQLRFEEEFAVQFGCQSLVYLDPVFVERVSNRNDLTESEILTLQGFGLDPVKFTSNIDYRQSYDLFGTVDYKSMVDKHERIFKKSCKTKRKNDYLALHPEYRYF